MAFNATDLKSLQPISSANDDVSFAQECDFGDESKTNLTPASVDSDGQTSGGDYFPQKMLITEMDIQRAIELIDFMYRTGHAARTKRIPGPQTVQNGITALLAVEGNSIILQNITQDPSPTERWMRQPTSTVLTAISGQDLTSTIAPASGTFPETITPNRVLTVKLSGAALSNTSTPGTLRLRGTDTDGGAYDQTFTFANDALTDTQETNVSIATLTGAVATGFSAGTVTVSTTYTTAPTGPADEVSIATGLDVTQSGQLSFTDTLKTVENPVRIAVKPQTGSEKDGEKLRATVTIFGTDLNDNNIAERLSFKGSGVPRPQTTKRFFKTVTHGLASDWKSGSTVNITAQDSAVEITYRPQDSGLIAFLTAAVNKGTIPYIYRSLIANGFNIAVDRNDVLKVVMAMMGRKGLPRQNFTEKGTNAAPHDLSAIKTAEALIYAGYQVKTTVEGVTVPFIDQTLSIAQNLAYSGIQAGTPFEEMRPYRSAKRDVMIDGTIQMTKENNLVDAFTENDTFEDVRWTAKHNDLGSFGWELECVIETAQLGTDADPASPNFDRYAQQCNIMAFDDESGRPSDFYFRATYAALAGARARHYTL